MKIKALNLYSYKNPMTKGLVRLGVLINIIDEKGNEGWGEIAPLPKWSKETLEDSLHSLSLEQDKIIKTEWKATNCLDNLALLKILPSALFGLESALLSIVSPLPQYEVEICSLLIGSKEEILKKAAIIYTKGVKFVKLKVSQMTFKEAFDCINQLKNKFRLRIDVNCAWETKASLLFFSQFPLDTFDYVEEPFQNPQDLTQFLHPLAIDESFPNNLSLKELELLPTLKAIVYKPTIQGGLTAGLPLYEWAHKNKISFVLSSSFESDLGLSCIASMAHRLGLVDPIGIGTYEYLNEFMCDKGVRFDSSKVFISLPIQPKVALLNKRATRGL